MHPAAQHVLSTLSLAARRFPLSLAHNNPITATPRDNRPTENRPGCPASRLTGRGVALVAP
jgi:hypothetical protein